MKEISEILENYEEYATFLDDRFGKRLCSFLTIEQMSKIGFTYTDESKEYRPQEWTEENILSQLKEDVEFGWEKACAERGISSSLMYEVVKSWCKVLENGLEDCDDGEILYLNDIFETKEDAEWYKEFGCIERTERLELPTWEEFISNTNGVEFNRINGDKIRFHKLSGDKVFTMYDKNGKIHFEREWFLTKENYTLACRKAKELFLKGDVNY